MSSRAKKLSKELTKENNKYCNCDNPMAFKRDQSLTIIKCTKCGKILKDSKRANFKKIIWI